VDQLLAAELDQIFGAAITVHLDENSDGLVSPEEFLRDELTAILLTLDVDLFALDGAEMVYCKRPMKPGWLRREAP
jgi:hypothetical protein